MDLKIYFQKVRETEAGIGETDAVVVSLDTPDGGRAGVRTEVSRRLAAQMVVDGRARLATAREAKEFREQVAEAKRQADELAAANRMQLTVLSTAELKRLKEAAKPAKD